MLATFCLRLACGMSVAVLVLSPAQVNARFYRVQFLSVLGLTALAAFLLLELAGATLWIALGLTIGAAFLGSLVWSLENAPGGMLLTALTAASSVALLVLARLDLPTQEGPTGFCNTCLLADDLTSAALLGSATTAMLMGHSYLIAPTMALTPLFRLLTALFVAILARMGCAGAALWTWSARQPSLTLEGDALLWLPLRWGLGFVLPLVLAGMAWQTTRIRSTQSSTGILYVVVIFCFLGEMTSLVLQRNSGFLW